MAKDTPDQDVEPVEPAPAPGPERNEAADAELKRRRDEAGV